MRRHVPREDAALAPAEDTIGGARDVVRQPPLGVNLARRQAIAGAENEQQAKEMAMAETQKGGYAGRPRNWSVGVLEAEIVI